MELSMCGGCHDDSWVKRGVGHVAPSPMEMVGGWAARAGVAGWGYSSHAAGTGICLLQLTLPASPLQACCVAFDRDDALFATVGVSRRIKLFDFAACAHDEAGGAGVMHYPVLQVRGWGMGLLRKQSLDDAVHCCLICWMPWFCALGDR